MLESWPLKFEKSIVMVTGGSGLVGSAIKDYVTANPKENEEWVFLSSKDGDLRKDQQGRKTSAGDHL